MRVLSRSLPTIVSGLFIVALFIVPFVSSYPVDYLRGVIEGNNVVSVLAFIFLMFIATVIAPIAALPLVPLATPFFGPYLTALYAIIGWGGGAIVAFLLARHIGRPLLSKFVSLDTVSRYEKRLPEHMTFWWLIFLRMIIPVDILSYAVGFVSTMSLRMYTVATFIGITPFAVIFSFSGMMFAEGSYYTLGVFIVAAAVLFLSVVYFLKKRSVLKDTNDTD